MQKRTSTGLAIGVMLLIIVLLAGLAMAIALGSRFNGPGDADFQNRTLASTIIHQASYIQRATDEYLMRGINTCRVSFTKGSSTAYPYQNHYIFDPQFVDVPEQIAPVEALVDPAQGWSPRYSLCFGTLHEPGVGGSAYSYTRGHYGVLLPDIKKGVCEQINQLLWDSKTISVSTDTLTTWVQFWNNNTLWPGNSNQNEACFETSDGHYVFYTLVFIVDSNYVAYDPAG